MATINGTEYSSASITLDFAGRKFVGVSSLNWSEELTPEDQYGFSPVAVGRTLGQYKASGDFEQLLSEYTALLKVLGNGYGTKPFNIGVQYREEGSDLVKVEIIAARIAKADASNAQGPAGTRMKVSLSIIQPIRINGLTLVDRARNGGLRINPASL